MTKEEVLRALEICKRTNNEGDSCPDCPYYVGSASCISELMDDAYNLLKEVIKK